MPCISILLSTVALVVVASGCSGDLPNYWKSSHSTSQTDSEPIPTGQCSVDTEAQGCLDTDPSDKPTDSQDSTQSTQTETQDTTTVSMRYPDFCGNPAYLPYALSDIEPFDRTGAPYLGAMDRPEVVIDVYAYFYCPHCRNAAESFGQMYKDLPYATRTVLYFGHYAFSDDIENSVWEPHRAAHAAHLQGAFWPMHDLIFTSQGQLEYPGLMAMAQSLGLDMNRYAADYDSLQTESYLIADRNEVKAAGATGTPAAFVNGLPVQPWTAVRDIVDCLLGPSQ